MTRRNKYNVSAKADRTLDGIVFASKGEMIRWQELKLLERARQIRNLRRQVHFDLVAWARPGEVTTDHLIGVYVADFVYLENGAEVVEDYSGFMNALKRYKLKHFKAQYGREVRITGAASRKLARAAA